MRGVQYGFDWAAFRSIFPPNFTGGSGSRLLLANIVALGEPASP